MGIFGKEPSRKNIYDSLKRLTTSHKPEETVNFNGNFHRIFTSEGMKIVSNDSAAKFMRYYRASMSVNQSSASFGSGQDLPGQRSKGKTSSHIDSESLNSIGTLAPLRGRHRHPKTYVKELRTPDDAPAFARKFWSHPRRHIDSESRRVSAVLGNRFFHKDYPHMNGPRIPRSRTDLIDLPRKTDSIRSHSTDLYLDFDRFSISDGFANDVLSSRNLDDWCSSSDISHLHKSCSDEDPRSLLTEETTELYDDFDGNTSVEFPVPFYLVGGLTRFSGQPDLTDVNAFGDASSFQDYDDIDYSFSETKFRADDYGNMFHRKDTEECLDESSCAITSNDELLTDLDDLLKTLSTDTGKEVASSLPDGCSENYQRAVFSHKKWILCGSDLEYHPNIRVTETKSNDFDLGFGLSRIQKSNSPTNNQEPTMVSFPISDANIGRSCLKSNARAVGLDTTDILRKLAHPTKTVKFVPEGDETEFAETRSYETLKSPSKSEIILPIKNNSSAPDGPASDGFNSVDSPKSETDYFSCDSIVSPDESIEQQLEDEEIWKSFSNISTIIGRMNSYLSTADL